MRAKFGLRRENAWFFQNQLNITDIIGRCLLWVSGGVEIVRGVFSGCPSLKQRPPATTPAAARRVKP